MQGAGSPQRFARDRGRPFGFGGDVVECMEHLRGGFPARGTVVAQGAELFFDLVHDVVGVDRGEMLVADADARVPAGVVADPAWCIGSGSARYA